MDQRTRKPITMNKVLHPRDNVDRLHVSRKEGGEDLPALKLLTHQYNDLKTTYKSAEKYSYQNNTNNTRTNRTTINRKMGRKPTLWTLKATNKQQLTKENIDVAKKSEP